MRALRETWRRTNWFTDQMTPRTALNSARVVGAMLTRREKMRAWPAILKIDISPACNLKCPFCVHADDEDVPALEAQNFKGKRMHVQDYRRIVDECKGKVSAFSLYYLGDPYAHPAVDELCRIAFDAGINVHISSNFSFKFSDKRIREICESGLTHLTVCVDGFSQATYEQTRVGGRLDFVLSNLERLLAYRNENNLQWPKVEVQYIKFRHNAHEYPAARAWLEKHGVDHVETFWGKTHNLSDLDPDNYEVFGPKKKIATGPRCVWPHGAMTIKYDGNVIPCCKFRHADQYEDSDNDPKHLGNVFEQGVFEVWNSEPYRQARRLVLDPSAADRDPALKEHFCYGCPFLYESSHGQHFKLASDDPLLAASK